MQSLEDPFVIMVAFVITIMIMTLVSFSIFGKAGKKTLKTYGKGRTKSEKSLYMFATVGILTLLIVAVFLIAYVGILEVPALDITFDLTFIVDNVLYVGVFVFVIGFIVIYTLIFMHQKGTNFGKIMKEAQKGDIKR